MPRSAQQLAHQRIQTQSLHTLDFMHVRAGGRAARLSIRATHPSALARATPRPTGDGDGDGPRGHGDQISRVCWQRGGGLYAPSFAQRHRLEWFSLWRDDAETYMNVGDAMGTAMVKMLKADQN